MFSFIYVDKKENIHSLLGGNLTMRKRILALMLTATMVLSLTACGAKQSDTTDLETNTESSSGTTSDFAVSMVADTGGVNDQSYNQSAWEGLEEFSKQTGAKVGYLESTQASDYGSNFDKLSDQNLDLIWGIGFTMEEPLLEAAEINPDKTFAILDNEYGDATPSNVACAVFNVQDSSFLVGYIAGLTTKTDRVGYIGGMKSPTMDLFEYGYRAGVDYASKELGKTIVADIQFAESFTDAAKGKAMAAAMYSAGSDILFHAAGGVGVGAIEQAVEENKLIIGVDRDQSYLAPNNVLTSALKIVGIATQELSKKVMDGEEIGGKTFAYGLAEGAVGIPTENPNMDPAIYEKAMEVQELIKNGEIVVPFDEESYGSFQK